MNPEAPEADVHEQQQEVVPQDPPETPRTPFEANEADAYEQQQEVPLDEDEA